MDKPEIYMKLKTIQRMAWEGDDTMSQETLFEMQEQLAELCLALAQDCGYTRDLAESFPFLYKTV